MFLAIAIGAIGVGVVIMIGYLVVAQVIDQFPESGSGVNNLTNITNAMNSTKLVIISGFGLLGVGVIVVAAFGLINIFK